MTQFLLFAPPPLSTKYYAFFLSYFDKTQNLFSNSGPSEDRNCLFNSKPFDISSVMFVTQSRPNASTDSYKIKE